MIKIAGKLFVCFLADTEDNHPNYLPGWKKYGTDYDIKKVMPRFEWLSYFDSLIDLFEKNGFPVTWFLRTDLCIKDRALIEFLPYLKKMKTVGIHIHTFDFDGKIWRQTQDSKKQRIIVRKSIELFKKTLGFSPLISRMGWNAMSNEIMKELEKNKILYDCSSVPGYFSKGFFNERDNIIDWKNAQITYYHPSYNDYKAIGDMDITEIPVSSIDKNHLVYNDFYSKIFNFLNKNPFNKALPFIISLVNSANLKMHSNFNISPNWKAEGSFSIINFYADSVRKGNNEILAGYFHPSDVLDPKTGKINLSYLSKVQKTFDFISGLDVEIVPCSIPVAMEMINK